MEAIYSSETSVHTRTTRFYIQGDMNFQIPTGSTAVNWVPHDTGLWNIAIDQAVREIDSLAAEEHSENDIQR
jgi:hypothetical protein